MRKLLLAASSLVLLLSGCAPPAADVAPAAAPKVSAGKVGPDGRIDADPALWVVKDEDTTVYLFGTVHVLRPDIDWFDGPVRAAYDASSELMLEMVEPEGPAAQAAVTKIVVDPDGPPLTQEVASHTHHDHDHHHDHPGSHDHAPHVSSPLDFERRKR